MKAHTIVLTAFAFAVPVIAARPARAADAGAPAPDKSKDSGSKGKTGSSDHSKDDKGIGLTPLKRKRTKDGAEYTAVVVEFQRAERIATITVRGPDRVLPKSVDEMVAQGAEFWPLRLARAFFAVSADRPTASDYYW